MIFDATMETSATLLVSAVIFGAICLLLLSWHQKDDSYPTGPSTLPLLGNMHQILWAGSIVNFLQQQRKVYGDVFTLTFGGCPKVVISGSVLMQDVFVKNAECTSERTINILPSVLVEYLNTAPGLFWAPYPHWKDMRSFALNVLREKMGVCSLEPQIIEEVQAYITAFIEPQEGKFITIKGSLAMATSNIIAIFALGKRFPYNDARFQQFVNLVQSEVETVVKAGMFNHIPLLRYLPWDFTGLQEYHETLLTLMSYVETYIAERRNELEHGDFKDYIDHYLIHRQKEQRNDHETFFSERNLYISIVQLFSVGTHPTCTLLLWAFFYVCLSPDIQEKLHSEIDSKLGPQHRVAYSDRFKMPYMDAVYYEVLRISNISAVGLPRLLTKDLIIKDKLVLAGSQLLMNMESIMFDAEIFDEPQTFKPERFLGIGAAKKQLIFPFGLGSRICPAESLVKMEFFLILTSILQRYAVSSPDGSHKDNRSFFTLINSPPSFRVIFHPRHAKKILQQKAK